MTGSFWARASVGVKIFPMVTAYGYKTTVVSHVFFSEKCGFLLGSMGISGS